MRWLKRFLFGPPRYAMCLVELKDDGDIRWHFFSTDDESTAMLVRTLSEFQSNSNQRDIHEENY